MKIFSLSLALLLAGPAGPAFAADTGIVVKDDVTFQKVVVRRETRCGASPTST